MHLVHPLLHLLDDPLSLGLRPDLEVAVGHGLQRALLVLEVDVVVQVHREPLDVEVPHVVDVVVGPAVRIHLVAVALVRLPERLVLAQVVELSQQRFFKVLAYSLLGLPLLLTWPWVRVSDSVRG